MHAQELVDFGWTNIGSTAARDCRGPTQLTGLA